MPTAQNTTTTFAFGVTNIKVEDTKGLFAKMVTKYTDVDLATASYPIVGKNIINDHWSWSITFDLSANGISSAFYSHLMKRYSVHYSNGTIEDLTSDQFVLRMMTNSNY